MSAATKQIAQRLIETREALGFHGHGAQVAFCKEIGVKKNVYNPFEKGERRISVDVALKIKKRFNVPTDWIYAGDPSSLPANIYRKLGRTAA